MNYLLDCNWQFINLLCSCHEGQWPLEAPFMSKPNVSTSTAKCLLSNSKCRWSCSAVSTVHVLCSIFASAHDGVPLLESCSCCVLSGWLLGSCKHILSTHSWCWNGRVHLPQLQKIRIATRLHLQIIVRIYIWILHGNSWFEAFCTFCIFHLFM